MKQSVTQIVLGALIVLFISYAVYWAAFLVEPLLDDMIQDESGTMINNTIVENKTLFDTARYASGLVLALGLAVVLTEVCWKNRETRKKLAIIHIVIGAFIVAVAAFIIRWAYALEFIVPIEGGPMLDLGYSMIGTIISGLLGLGVIIAAIIRRVRFPRELEESKEKAKMPYDVLSLRRR